MLKQEDGVSNSHQAKRQVFSSTISLDYSSIRLTNETCSGDLQNSPNSITSKNFRRTNQQHEPIKFREVMEESPRYLELSGLFVNQDVPNIYSEV